MLARHRGHCRPLDLPAIKANLLHIVFRCTIRRLSLSNRFSLGNLFTERARHCGRLEANQTKGLPKLAAVNLSKLFDKNSLLVFN